MNLSNHIENLQNELKKYPHSRSLKGVQALSMYRGIQSSNKYVKAFYIARSIEKQIT